MACTNTSSNYLPTNPSTPVVPSATPTNNFGFTSTPTFTLQPTLTATHTATGSITPIPFTGTPTAVCTPFEPAGIAVDPSTGYLYVAGGDGNFYIFNGSSQVATFNQYNYPGTSNFVSFSSLGGVAIDTTNKVYYILQTGSGANTGAVYEFYMPTNALVTNGAWNNPVTTWNNFSGGSIFNNPGGIALDSTTGNVYVADTQNQQIDEFAQGTLNPTNQWGTLGPGTGQFNNPSAVAYYSGSIYVADASNQRIEVFDTSGNYQRYFATAEGSDIFSICLDGSGDLYAGDCNQANPLVEEYDPSGNLKSAWSNSPTNYFEPDGVFYYSGSLYVADYDNNYVDQLTL